MAGLSGNLGRKIISRAAWSAYSALTKLGPQISGGGTVGGVDFQITLSGLALRGLYKFIGCQTFKARKGLDYFECLAARHLTAFAKAVRCYTSDTLRSKV
jgi:hypothetical protein